MADDNQQHDLPLEGPADEKESLQMQAIIDDHPS